MKLFPDKKMRAPKPLRPFILKIFARINSYLKLCAESLQRKTNGYSPLRKKVALMLFCAAFLSECIYVVYRSFQTRSTVSYSPARIQSVPLLKSEPAPLLIDEKEFTHIRDFKHSLDSLKTHNKEQFDSLLAARPHLLDTINYLENLYYEQQSNRK